MAAGMSGVPAIGPVPITANRPKATATRSFQPTAAAKDAPHPRPVQPDRLRLPEERAFQVSTINARLAILAAQAEESPRPGLDIKV